MSVDIAGTSLVAVMHPRCGGRGGGVVGRARAPGLPPATYRRGPRTPQGVEGPSPPRPRGPGRRGPTGGGMRRGGRGGGAGGGGAPRPGPALSPAGPGEWG